MALELCCRDVGADCDYVVRGETEEEFFANASKHAKEAHGMDSIPEELKEKVMAAVRAQQA